MAKSDKTPKKKAPTAKLKVVGEKKVKKVNKAPTGKIHINAKLKKNRLPKGARFRVEGGSVTAIAIPNGDQLQVYPVSDKTMSEISTDMDLETFNSESKEVFTSNTQATVFKNNELKLPKMEIDKKEIKTSRDIAKKRGRDEEDETVEPSSKIQAEGEGEEITDESNEPVVESRDTGDPELAGIQRELEDVPNTKEDENIKVNDKENEEVMEISGGVSSVVPEEIVTNTSIEAAPIVEDTTTEHGSSGRMQSAVAYLQQVKRLAHQAGTLDELQKANKRVMDAHDQIDLIMNSEKAKELKAVEVASVLADEQAAKALKKKQEEQIADNEHAQGSADNALSNNELAGQTRIVNVQIGAGVDIEMSENIDTKTVVDAKTTKENVHEQQVDEGDVVMKDATNTDKNGVLRTLMSAFNAANGENIFSPGENIWNDSTSANKMHASLTRDDVVMTDSKTLVKRLREEQEAARKEIEALRKDVRMSDEVRLDRIKIQTELIAAKEAEIKANIQAVKEKSQGIAARRAIANKIQAQIDAKLQQSFKERQALERQGGHIEGFAEHALEAKKLGIIKDDKDPKQLAYLYGVLLKASQVDPTTMQTAPTPAEISTAFASQELGRLNTSFTGTNEAGNEDIIDFPLGGQPLGSKVFAPVDASQQMAILQQSEILKITLDQQKELKKELAPYWSEFKLQRLNAGITEAEIIGTNLFKSSKSTVRAGAQVRDDIDQREESFGNFMFFMLHHKFGAEQRGGLKWRKFLMWSAALGYNQLTTAQINWLVTGNINGDLSDLIDFSSLLDIDEKVEGILVDAEGHVSKGKHFKIARGSPEHKKRLERFNAQLDKQMELFPGVYTGVGTIQTLDFQTEAIHEPVGRYPSRNVSPSAIAIDNSIHPDGTNATQRLAQKTISGLPAGVLNIPDPRTSERGGQQIPNVREVTVRNRDFDPTLKKTDPKYQEEFIQMEVPDIAVGSKDIQAQVEAAEADRVLNSIPQRLYAPIHAQACDRYLGARNYKRLSVPDEKYMKSYSDHGWGVEDTSEMYAWNVFIMQAYGPILYSFVTNPELKRTTPVFDSSVAPAVLLEFKELNELVKELKRFQEKSEDRADRISGGSAVARPIEKALNKFFDDRKNLDAETGAEPPNSIVVAGNTPFGRRGEPGGTAGPTADPNADAGEQIINAGNIPQHVPKPGLVKPESSSIDSHTMNFGITNTPLIQQSSLADAVFRKSTTVNKFVSTGVDFTKRQRMFNSFGRR
jgi:hypothetical protein